MYLVKHKWQRRIVRIPIILIVVAIVYAFLILPALLRLGATQYEFSSHRPGDELLRSIDYKNTLAVSVRKPPAEIWPWVAQMGLNKGGFYSYTWLENLFGCNLRNADKIHPEWQHPQLGYYEGVCESAVNKNMPGWRVAVVEPGRSLVWRGEQGEWMMGVYIDSVDQSKSRVITRMLYKSAARFSGSWWLEKLWFEWAHCIMQRGMIRGIKKRAEQF